MNRATAATAATAALAAGTLAAAATIAPAMAAPRHSAAHTARVIKKAAHRTATTTAAKLAAQAAKVAGDPTVTIGSEVEGGRFVTVVTCQGAATPPPIQVGLPGTPLTAHGTGPSAGILAMLSKPNPYKTVYTCTVVVKQKVPTPAAPSSTSTSTSPSTSTSTSPSTSTSTSTSTSRSTSKTTVKARPKICVTVVKTTGRTQVCRKSVTVSTGFGGMAPQVKVHQPTP